MRESFIFTGQVEVWMPLSQQRLRTQETHPQLEQNLELLPSPQTTAPIKCIGAGRKKTYTRLCETPKQGMEGGLEQWFSAGEGTGTQGHLGISGDSCIFHNLDKGDEVLLAADE